MTPVFSEPSYGCEPYEQLRQEALADPLGRRGHGMSLFLTRGMSAWLTALSALRPRDTMPLGGEPPSACSVTEFSPAIRLDLTKLLADMVLACSQEAAR